MKTSELMKFPKIRARLEKYWDNDKASGQFGTPTMADNIQSGFVFFEKEEGFEFWNNLWKKEFEDCIAIYPDWFKDRELDYDPKDVAFTKNNGKDNNSDQSLLAKFLINQFNNTQGYGSFSTKYKPTTDELVSIAAELDRHYSAICYTYSVFCELESDGSGCISVRNYYPDSKTSKDLLLMTFGDK